MKLTPKQQRFVAEYLLDLNATQAAIRAGYSARTAAVIGDENLRKPYIKEAVSEAMKARELRTEITQDMVLKELAKIGFSDIRKAINWGAELPVTNPDTGEVLTANGVLLVNSSDLDGDTAAAISEIAQTANGIKLKLYDKRAALVDIGKHLGMFVERKELTGKDGTPLMPPVFNFTMDDGGPGEEG